MNFGATLHNDLTSRERTMTDEAHFAPCETVSALLRARIAAGDFPSAVYLVSQAGRVRFADALGDAVRAPERHPATLETVYDLASLTKPLVTGFLSALFYERGRIELSAHVEIGRAHV